VVIQLDRLPVDLNIQQFVSDDWNDQTVVDVLKQAFSEVFVAGYRLGRRGFWSHAVSPLQQRRAPRGTSAVQMPPLRECKRKVGKIIRQVEGMPTRGFP
jgi:hypothetical protein